MRLPRNARTALIALALLCFAAVGAAKAPIVLHELFLTAELDRIDPVDEPSVVDPASRGSRGGGALGEPSPGELAAAAAGRSSSGLDEAGGSGDGGGLDDELRQLLTDALPDARTAGPGSAPDGEPGAAGSGQPQLTEGDGGAGDSPMVLDDRTGESNPPPYVEVYTPPSIPWKRIGVRDRLEWRAGVPSFDVTEGPWSAAPDRGVAQAESRRARGLIVDPVRGDWAPLPSLSPDMLVLSTESDSGDAVDIERDALGRFRYRLRADATARSIRWTVATPLSYDAGTERLPSHAVPHRPVPGSDVAWLLQRLGLESERRGEVVLPALHAYFSSFVVEALAAPEPGESLFRTILRQQRGVCRHRATAFAATARELGYDAHVVTNETHAFAEVRVPGAGWRRVDMGGSHSIAAAPAPTMPPATPPEPPAPPAQVLGAPGAEPPVADDRGDAASQVARIPTRLEFEASPTTVRRGERLVVAGRLTTADLRPVASASIDLVVYAQDAEEGAHGRRLGSVRTLDDGRFSWEGPVPAAMRLGTWELVSVFRGRESLRPAVSTGAAGR
jgi:hypothetical protein